MAEATVSAAQIAIVLDCARADAGPGRIGACDAPEHGLSARVVYHEGVEDQISITVSVPGVRALGDRLGFLSQRDELQRKVYATGRQVRTVVFGLGEQWRENHYNRGDDSVTYYFVTAAFIRRHR